MMVRFVLLFLLAISNFVAAQEYVVKFKELPSLEDFERLRKKTNETYELSGLIKDLKLAKITSKTTTKTQELTQRLRKFFDVEYVVPNARLHAFINDADPMRGQQWALDIIKARNAWEHSLGSASVVVAVIDTGLALTHEDLRANLWLNTRETANNGLDDDNNGYIDDLSGWDFRDNDKDANDETSAQNPGHGTHCSGIIGAVCGNDVGICGISPVVSIMPLRFLGADGSGDLFASIKAIDYAINNGAHVISASWGANIPESEAQPLIEAIRKAEEKGVIFVAAAANDGKSNDSASVYPANAQTPHMISVAASNSSDQKPAWSNYGRKVDLAAPGEDILSTIPNNSYRKLSGTSMATPLVAGLVALMKSLDLNLSGAESRSILQSTGKVVNIATASNRRIDAQKALEAVKNRTLTLVPAAKTLKIQDSFEFSAWGGSGSYKFSSLNPDILEINEAGQALAKAVGDATIEVFDSQGSKAQSVSIKVSDGLKPPPPGGAECPFGNEFLCSIMCAIQPQLPWCSKVESPLSPYLPEPFPLPKPHTL